MEDKDLVKSLSDAKAVQRQASIYIAGKGVMQLVKEIFDNVKDEINNSKSKLKGDTLFVVFDVKNNTLWASDNSNGIPYQPTTVPSQFSDAEYEISSLLLIFSKLNAGGKFTSNSYENSIGMNGIGIKLVNFLSSSAFITNYDTKNKEFYYVKTSKGIKVKETDKHEPSSKVLSKVYNFDNESDEKIFVPPIMLSHASLNGNKTGRGTIIAFKPEKQFFMDQTGQNKLNLESIENMLKEKSVVMDCNIEMMVYNDISKNEVLTSNGKKVIIEDEVEHISHIRKYTNKDSKEEIFYKLRERFLNDGNTLLANDKHVFEFGGPCEVTNQAGTFVGSHKYMLSFIKASSVDLYVEDHDIVRNRMNFVNDNITREVSQNVTGAINGLLTALMVVRVFTSNNIQITIPKDISKDPSIPSRLFKDVKDAKIQDLLRLRKHITDLVLPNMLFFSDYFMNPNGVKFSSQTKDALVGKDVLFNAYKDAYDYFIQYSSVPANNKYLVELTNVLVNLGKHKTLRQTVTLSTNKGTIPDNYEPALKLGYGSGSQLVLVEGTSAMSNTVSAKLNSMGVLALSGKIRNVKKNPLGGVDKTPKHIQNILDALGVGTGNKFKMKDLNYDYIYIMTDADDDGRHISLLLKGFFHQLMPEMIEDNRIYEVHTPLYFIEMDKSNTSKVFPNGKKYIYVYNIIEKDEIIKYCQNNNIQKYTITRFKGLGEMSVTQLNQSTMSNINNVSSLLTMKDFDAEHYEKCIDDVIGDQMDFRKSMSNVLYL